MREELKTKALVLRRTNYSEADRILNLITPEGKISAYAKGARKQKSKLAGGVEMFTLSEMNLHFGKSDMATVTSARMIKFYSAILKDLNKMELATEILKKISIASESVDTPKHFEIAAMCLEALNDGMDTNVVNAWFLLNLAKAMGEQINLVTDVNGDDLEAGEYYDWDVNEKAFFKNSNGKYDANVIKVMRIMWGMDLETTWRIRDLRDYVTKALEIAKLCYN